MRCTCDSHLCLFLHSAFAVFSGGFGISLNPCLRIAKIHTMLRKLLKVLSAVIVALSLFPLAAEPAIAAEGAYAATAAAFASYVSAGRPALQGVSYSEGLGVFPSMISFSRSDISTYPMSFQFFSSGSKAEALFRLLMPEHILEHVFSSQISAEDLVVDGTVRFTWLSEQDPEYFDDKSDLTGASVSLAISLIVTGNLAGDGVILEGDIILTGGEGRTVSIAPGSTIMIDGVATEVDPLVFTIAMIGGEYGQMQRIS